MTLAHDLNWVTRGRGHSPNCSPEGRSRATGRVFPLSEVAADCCAERAQF